MTLLLDCFHSLCLEDERGYSISFFSFTPLSYHRVFSPALSFEIALNLLHAQSCNQPTVLPGSHFRAPKNAECRNVFLYIVCLGVRASLISSPVPAAFSSQVCLRPGKTIHHTHIQHSWAGSNLRKNVKEREDKKSKGRTRLLAVLFGSAQPAIIISHSTAKC